MFIRREEEQVTTTMADLDLHSDSMHWQTCRASTRKRKAFCTLVVGLIITIIVLLVMWYQPKEQEDTYPSPEALVQLGFIPTGKAEYVTYPIAMASTDLGNSTSGNTTSQELRETCAIKTEMCSKDGNDCRTALMVDEGCLRTCEFTPTKEECWGRLTFWRTCVEINIEPTCQQYCCTHFGNRTEGTLEDVGARTTMTDEELDSVSVDSEQQKIINYLTCEGVRLTDLKETTFYDLTIKNCKELGYLPDDIDPTSEALVASAGGRRESRLIWKVLLCVIGSFTGRFLPPQFSQPVAFYRRCRRYV